MPALTLRQRAATLCVVVGTVLALLAAGAVVVAAQNRTHLNTLLTETGPLRTDGEALLSALVNQETGIRGYAVSGDRGDLATYEGGVTQEREITARMARLLAGEPAIRQQVRAVTMEAARWRAEVAQPVIETTAARGTAAGQALLTDAARQRFDRVRASVNVVQDSVVRLRDEVSRNARRTGNLLVLLLVVAAAVVVIAGLALMTSLDRLLIEPVTRLAQQVRDIAAGDYDRVIEGDGAPELARLAGDVDAMRRRIAADLAEVREARTRVEWVNSQLQKQAEELVRSNRDLEQFAYVASHDLQEPLRKVASFCQLLQRRYAGQLDERADQYIAFAVDGAQRMQRLINDLLAFSRIGRLASGFTDVDLNKVLGEVAAQTGAARQYVGGELTWSDLPVVRGEEALLGNLLANLVSNSLKFRRPDLPPRAHLSARRTGDEWEITCQDNGIGIEPEFAEKIFIIFQRLHAKDAYPGTGIGLAIVKKIVEYHGGRVWVDPDVRDGAAVRFTLPASGERDGAAGGTAQPGASPVPTPGGDAPAGLGGDTPADTPVDVPDQRQPAGVTDRVTAEAADMPPAAEHPAGDPGSAGG